MYLQFETNNRCNAACSFCPHPDMKKRPEMPDNMIEKIVNEVVPTAQTCFPFLYQEPLMEKRLVQILQKIKQINPNCSTGIYTNAGLLTSEKSKEIIEALVLDQIFISFYGPTEELHKKYQKGLDWNKTKENIIALMQNRLGFLKPTVTMWYIEIPELMEYIGKMQSWKTIVDQFGVVPYETFCGLKEEIVKYSGTVRKPCSRLWNQMNILADGTVIPCCLDYSGVVNLGNAFDENCWDIWYGEKFYQLRHLHKTEQWSLLPELCKKCTVWKRV